MLNIGSSGGGILNYLVQLNLSLILILDLARVRLGIQ